MKIIAVEVYLLDGGRESWRPVVCRVLTNEGMIGYGEASVGFDTGAKAAFGMVCEISKLIIGMDPMNTEQVWNRMFYDSFWGQGGGAAEFGAVSAIDMACWDIKGKALGVPLYMLLGGKCRDKLRCYASQLQFGWGEDGMVFDKGYRSADIAKSAVKAVEEGYDSIKINFITYDQQGNRLGFLKGPIPLTVKQMIKERMKEVRNAIGESVDIIVENHGRTDEISAFEMCELMKPYQIYYMEEAFTPFQYEAGRELYQKTGIPMAGGERVFGKWNYANIVEKKSLQIVQPDIGTCGGITEAKKICDLANSFETGVQLHICGSPIVIAASLQLEAAITNFVIHEHHVTNRSENNRTLGVYDYQPVNGYQTIPQLPGIGQELSIKAMKTALQKEVIR